MYYQPIFNTKKEILKLEALIRWNHPEKGLILPGSFIHIAEETGFINELSEWIFDNVFEQINHWHSDNAISVSINVSLFQFANTKLVQILTNAVNKYNIDTSKITLELTESIGIENFSDALEKLNLLKSMGFYLAIDDFGTGYSSFNYLLKMPIDILKLDQSFVAKIGSDDNSEQLIEIIKVMSNQLDLDVVVEGVETEEQFEFLKNLGYQSFQGFLVSKAVPVNKINISNFIVHST
jgi:EAL domain-containing protein (putative c-di-GMP-specific phosphodiesterase class I)